MCRKSRGTNPKNIIMKKLFTLLAVAMVATGASAQTFTTNITVNTAIPDNNPSGLASGFNVSGLNGSIGSISLALNVTGGYNGDLFAYLTGPGGYAALLNRTGLSAGNPNGYANTGLAVTFITGGPDIHTYGAGSFTTNGLGQLTGNWGADGRNISPLSTGGTFDLTSRTALLDSFIGGNANGAWGLFIGDYANGDISTLLSYSLSVTTVPEPGTVALLALGGFGWRSLRRRQA
jgi:subtilisin-like proprotein convertase family protein